jgi:integrase
MKRKIKTIVSAAEERARHEKRAKTTRGRLKKIPNCPGLYRHASGKYYMIRKIKGKIVVACLDTSDQTTAKRILQGKTQTLQLRQGETPTLQNLCARFLETKAERTKGMVKNYRWVIGRLERDFPKFTWPIDQILPSDLAIYFVELAPQIGPRSFNHFTEIVGMIFQLAVNANHLDRNPVLLIPKKDRRKRIERKRNTEATIPTLQQFEKIVADIRSQQFADTRQTTADFVSFCALASIGEAEANSVSWEDVDWKAQRINFIRRKTGKAFYVPLFPWLKPFISELWQRSGKPVTGRIFNIRSAKQAIRNACKRLDFTFFSPRDFRKMGIVRQIRAGLDERMVAKFQGHSDNGQLIYSTYTSEFDSDEKERERKIIEGLKE